MNIVQTAKDFLNKIPKIAKILITVVLVILLLVGFFSGGKLSKSKTKSTLKTFLAHDGNEYLKHVPKDSIDASLTYHNISEDELTKTISEYASGLQGKTFEWDFGTDSCPYDWKINNLSYEVADSTTCDKLENKDLSKESMIDSKIINNTLEMREDITNVWKDFENVDKLYFVLYTYDLEYTDKREENKQGVDEEKQLMLTFVKYKGKWYCMDYIDMVTCEFTKTANTEANRKSWESVFGT